MADEASEVRCANSECRVAETGKCVEGLALAECPHYGKTALAPTPADAALGAVETGLPLPSAGRLPVSAAGEVLRAHRTLVVAVIGSVACGKTSLIASLYDLLQTGPIGGFAFARSKTFHAFERACHHARAPSRRTEPSIERTPRGAVEFYHLGLASADRGVVDVLLGDRAGEEYLIAIDNPSANANFIEVRRADVVTLLVDGERLLDSGARHNARNETEMMLQALIDGDVVAPEQRVVLVLTKLDAVHASSHRERAEADFAALQAKVRRLFALTFAEIDAFSVAASPKDVRLPRGHGVPALLRAWMAPPVTASPRPFSSAPSVRAFGRLAESR